VTNKDEGEPRTYSVPAAGEMLAPPISRNAAYRAVKAGDIPSIKIGKQLRVPGPAWRKMLAGE